MKTEAKGGLEAFIQDVERHARSCGSGRRGTIRFILAISDDYAYIRLADLARPLRFLRQISSEPPVQFGTQGFAPALVDDQNPARHYTAFVFIGFWLTYPLGVVVLWIWEILGFLRYRGTWSDPDLRLGLVGLRHGSCVRRHGPSVLTPLIARDLRSQTDSRHVVNHRCR